MFGIALDFFFCLLSKISVFGNTAVHYAAEFGKGKCFNCLIQHGGRISIQNFAGNSPMEMAKKAGHPLLMEKAGMYIYM